MTGHVLKFLGETKLELGPAGKSEGDWRVGRDSDDIFGSCSIKRTRAPIPSRKT